MQVICTGKGFTNPPVMRAFSTKNTLKIIPDAMKAMDFLMDFLNEIDAIFMAPSTIPAKAVEQFIAGVRRKTDIPLLVLDIAVHYGTHDRTMFLNAGADDVVRHLYPEEIEARLCAITRRRGGQTTAVLKFGDLHLNTSNREVWREEERKVILTAQRFHILEKLMLAPGRIFTRSQLRNNAERPEELVNSYISRLREDLDGIGSTVAITAIRQQGYKLCCPA